MSSRLKRQLGRCAVLLAAGLAYAWVVLRWPWLAIPCPFHRLTGLLCPACGVTTQCLALLRLDFAAAWRANPVLLPVLAVLAVVLARQAVRSLREGTTALTKGENVTLCLLIAVLAVWGVVRNLL